MPWLPLLLIGVPSVSYAAWTWIKTARAMRRFWDRPSTQAEWSSVFPNASPQDVQSFLELFIDAFVFTPKQLFCFAPHDRLSEIYDALYICGCRGAGGEMSCFFVMLERRYKVALAAEQFPQRSLGELFALAVPDSPTLPQTNGIEPAEKKEAGEK